MLCETENKTETAVMERAQAVNIEKWLLTINQFNSTPEFGTTRVLFTEPEVQTRAYVKSEMKKLGLQVHEDAIGNIFGILKGEQPELPPVWTGSHIDTVLNAGMFDGMSGVVAGMEAVRLLRKSGKKIKRSIVVIVYTSEEPTRFDLCCLGSRAMSGHLCLEQAAALTDKDGQTLTEVLTALNYKLDGFSEIPVEKGSVHAAVELHIDQTGELERAGKTIGIVKAICAPTNFDVVVTGRQSHAGGTSMQYRRDAFMAACELSLALEEFAQNGDSEYSTGTVGRVEVIPGASNVIPGKVVFSVDIRDCDFMSKQNIADKFKVKARMVEQQRQVKVEIIEYNNDYPMPCDENIMNKIEMACQNNDVSYIKTLSGAFHDSMFVGEFAPVGMIFVPSKDGISHSPKEWTEFKDIAIGADVLKDTLYALANE